MFWAFLKKSLCSVINGKCVLWQENNQICVHIKDASKLQFSWLHTQDFESRVQTHIKWSRKVRCQIFAGQLFLRSWWREKCELKHNSSIVIYVSYWCNSRRGCHIDKQHCNSYIQRYLDPISYCCCGLA